MALVVEDGTGKTNSEAYISVADANIYHTNFNGTTDWTTTSDAIKERVLRKATSVLDAENVLRWKGDRTNKSQALDWPRSDVRDSSEFFIDSNVIPVDLQRANAELALREITVAVGVIPDLANGGAIKREKVKVGPIESDIEFLAGGSPTTVFSVVKILLKDLIENPNLIQRS